MRLLISPAAGWKDVKIRGARRLIYFLMSNPPRKVNTTHTTRLAGKETVAGLLAPLFTTCSNDWGHREETPRGGSPAGVRPLAGYLSLAINKAAHVSIYLSEETGQRIPGGRGLCRLR